MKTMTGLMLLEKGKVELREKPIPQPGPFEALIKVTCAATCNTDLKVVEKFVMPSVQGRFLGHECVGVVAEVGSEVKYFKPGDRICVPSLTPEWRSIEAQQGGAVFSNGGMALDWGMMRDGTFAEYICCRDVDMNCAKIPDDITDLQAVMMCDMVSASFNGLDHVSFPLGSTAVVFGIGPVGLCAIAGIRHRGAGRIIAIGTNPLCIELAKEYGATDIVSYKDGDVVEQILDLNHGKVDFTMLCGGNGSTVSQAYRMTRPCGEICSVNAYYDDVVIGPDDWNNGMYTIKMTGFQNSGGRWMFGRYFDFLRYNKDFDPEKMITHINYGVESFETTLWNKKDSNCIKPVTILK